MNLVSKDTLRILQVDDSDDFAQITSIFLEQAGFKRPILRLDCGIKAIDYLLRVAPAEAPQVMLLDLDMPRKGGLDVLRWVRKNYPDRNLPVYILTGSDDPYDRRLAAAAEVTKYLLKSELYRNLDVELEGLITTHNQMYLEEINRMPETFAQLALLGDFSNDMVVLADHNGTIQWVNESFIQVCGYNLEELRGKKPGYVLQGPESDPSAVKTLHDAVHSLMPCECEIINYKKDGTPYPVFISLGPLYNDGQLEGFLSVEQDLSKEKNRYKLAQTSTAVWLEV